MKTIIDQLALSHALTKEQYLSLLDNMDEQTQKYLIEKAHAVRSSTFEDRVFMRGLIEFTNYCKQNCTYCGIRAD
ncbi:MAG: [FeFe] hydrogenase H-cluster radical SAM maturase HydE, partial [Hyphomonadaceae bacterium]|nr:[FeFe] hydrogenase H-cluster radical SAM maturase HydE [Clostridia bacterium]